MDESVDLPRLHSLDGLFVGLDGPHPAAGSFQDPVILQVGPRPSQAVLKFSFVAVLRLEFGR
jgi:hypothetical protein